MPTTVRCWTLLLALTCATAPRAHAQWMPGADVLTAKAVADSQARLKELNTAVAKSPNDAALRYQVGMIAWALAVRDEFKPSIGSLNGPLLKALADSSMRLAVKLDASRAKYELALERFLRSSSDPVLRLMAPAHGDRAIEAARTGPDSAMLPAALTERGRLAWLIYDSEAYETPYQACPGVPTSIETAASRDGMVLPTEVALINLHNEIAGCMRPDVGVGELDYLKAEDAFRESYRLTPNDTAAFRRLAMLYAERNRWAEITTMARERVNHIPQDGWAWLTLGLALHRSGESARASAIFDTATARLSLAERKRLFSFERLLGPRDSVAYAATSNEQRTAREKSFWAMADPLWSRQGNDPRTEFLARVVFAELRWTVEEYQVRGADSDRGEIHIRYGPPDGIWAFRCPVDIACGGGPTQPQKGQFMQLWDYNIGLTIAFWGAPTYGTMRFPQVDGGHIAYAMDLRSAAFDNVAAEKIIPMPLGILRFRAPSDSVDLLVLTQAPMAAVRAVTANAEVRAHSWLIGRNQTGGIRDSTVVAASGNKRAIYRVAPSTYMYRVEATAPGTLIAGRAMGWVVADRDTVTGFVLHGFGISDLLLASPAQPNAQVPARWRGLAIAPLVGPLARQNNLDIVWENYDLGARGGQSTYSVAVTLQRQRSKSGKVAAAILGAAANAVGIERRDDRVTFTFDRAMPTAAAAFVDKVSIGTAETPAGDYVITLVVTDKATGRKTERTTAITIVQ